MTRLPAGLSPRAFGGLLPEVSICLGPREAGRGLTVNSPRPARGDLGPETDAGRQPGPRPGAQGQQENLQPLPPPVGTANPGQGGEFWASPPGSQVRLGPWVALGSSPGLGASSRRAGVARVGPDPGVAGSESDALLLHLTQPGASLSTARCCLPSHAHPSPPHPPCVLFPSLLLPQSSHGFLCPHQPGFFSKLAAMFRGLIFHSSRNRNREVRASDGVSN